MAATRTIIKCIVIDDELMAREILKSLIEKTPFLQLVGEAEDTRQAIELISEHQIDLVFLDVEMPVTSGFDLLRGFKPMPSVIITTSHSNYALEAFDFSVLDFLLKPIDPGRFLQAVSKAQSNDTLSEKQVVFFKEESAYVRINLSEVHYLEAYGDFVKIFLTSGRKVFRSKMKDLEANLPLSFIRIHRSYIVNSDYIDKIEDSKLHINGVVIPVGKTYRDEVRKIIGT